MAYDDPLEQAEYVRGWLDGFYGRTKRPPVGKGTRTAYNAGYARGSKRL